jgi:hypothetical protein
MNDCRDRELILLMIYYTKKEAHIIMREYVSLLEAVQGSRDSFMHINGSILLWTTTETQKFDSTII